MSEGKVNGDALLACRGKGCTAQFGLAQAWVPALATIRKVVGRWPSVKDLKDHVHCAKCAVRGRRAGLRFYLHHGTVLEMEARRVRAREKVRQDFSRYLK